MRIYRLETKDGIGPYTREVYNPVEYDEDRPSYIDTVYDVHPDPYDCDIRWVYPSQFFGFPTKEAMMNWFFRQCDDGEKLANMGLYVTIYEIDAGMVEGDQRQVAFTKGEAERVSYLSPRLFQQLESSKGELCTA